jgi:hypothetical protein
MSRSRRIVFVLLILMSLSCGLSGLYIRPARPTYWAPHLLLPRPAGEQTNTVSSESAVTVAAATPSPNWKINHHGECCEGNLATQGSSVYLLLPILLTGNQIWRSDNDGQTWTKKYPPVDASVPYGIEGDLQAWGNDIDFFGTLLAQGVSAHSTDRGESWTVVPIPVAFPANDQSWSYLGPLLNIAPVGQVQSVPYVLAGWYRIGSVVLFSFDGGLTWPLQTPLVGDDGSGPSHVVCQQQAHAPTSPGDTRVLDQNFTNHKAGRHGAWGTDRKFYWTETSNGDVGSGSSLYVCKTDNFGATWTGIKHPLVPGGGLGYVVTHTGFDNKGTLYVLHGDQLYVSFNQGESFAFVHTLPRFGNALLSDSGADQFFVVNCGTIHIGLIAAGAGGLNDVYYLRGSHVDTATPTWDEEFVESVGSNRLDFFQIVVDGNGIPTMSYTTPGSEVTTASRYTPLPLTSAPDCPVVLQSVVSRKTHGALTPPGDLPLSFTGPATIEPRAGGISSGNHTLVFTFLNTLNAAIPVSSITATATTSSGPQSVTAMGSIGTDPHQYIVNLTGVPNASHLNVTLNSVIDSANNISNVSAHMDVLFGDVNSSGRTDAGDVTQVRNRTVSIPDTTDPASFRFDVNTSGRVDAGDVTATRNATVTVLP